MYTAAQKKEAREFLESRLFLDTSLIHTITRRVSRSGKTQDIDFLFIVSMKPSRSGSQVLIYKASHHIAALLELPLNDRGAVICKQPPEVIAGRLALLLLKNASRIFTREL